MAIPEDHKWRFFFHFTHVANLKSIIEHGILCTNTKNTKNITHVDVASESIQARRGDMDVTCEPKGRVHDYVPFYFTSINPMFLSVLNKKNQDQPLMIYLCLSIDKIEQENTIFTDASANTIPPPAFYNQSKNLVNLDWKNIDSRKWGFSDIDRHKKMAEVLVHSVVPMSDIDAIIVYNDSIKEGVVKIFNDCNMAPPKILFPYELAHGKYCFFYTKFFFSDRKRETLITGPLLLRKGFKDLHRNIIKKRKVKQADYVFADINDALIKITADFCVIEELKGIFELNTDNRTHKENVSNHTKLVVDNLDKSCEDKKFDDKDKNILKLSAYLHDIGKGPKSKWEDCIQKNYPDHPADAIPMLERILVEDFETLSNEEVRKICLLVVYHDLVGDIIEKGRDIQQVIDLVQSENELDLLIALSLSDVSSINKDWANSIKVQINEFKGKVLAKL